MKNKIKANIIIKKIPTIIKNKNIAVEVPNTLPQFKSLCGKNITSKKKIIKNIMSNAIHI